jgi:hypothetical protein
MKKPAMAALAALAVAILATTGCRPTKKTSADRPVSSASVPATTPTPDAPRSQASPTAPPATAAPPAAAAACRPGDPLANVYHEDRLSVWKTCLTVSGTVTDVRAEDDGDSHVYLALDPPDATSLKLTSLLLEIVPADKPGCTPGQPPRPASGSYDYGHCTGADESDPAVGSHVSVTGPYVYDEDHHWNEIHPVWAISASPGVATAPAPTTVPPAPTANASPTPPPAAPTGVTIVSVSSPVDAGAYASLVARTLPGGACSLSVTLPSGRQSQSSGLGPATADGWGQVSWNWRTGTTTRPGTATAKVTCGSASTTDTFQISG